MKVDMIMKENDDDMIKTNNSSHNNTNVAMALPTLSDRDCVDSFYVMDRER
jgi:predicted transcriptional regulator